MLPVSLSQYLIGHVWQDQFRFVIRQWFHCNDSRIIQSPIGTDDDCIPLTCWSHEVWLCSAHFISCVLCSIVLRISIYESMNDGDEHSSFIFPAKWKLTLSCLKPERIWDQFNFIRFNRASLSLYRMTQPWPIDELHPRDFLLSTPMCFMPRWVMTEFGFTSISNCCLYLYWTDIL